MLAGWLAGWLVILFAHVSAHTFVLLWIISGTPSTNKAQ